MQEKVKEELQRLEEAIRVSMQQLGELDRQREEVKQQTLRMDGAILTLRALLQEDSAPAQVEGVAEV